VQGRAYPDTPATRLQRSNAATRTGSQSEYRITEVSRSHKRRLLRQMGKRIGDLDGLSLALIDVWARGFAKVTLLDQFYSERGLIRDGEVDPSLKVYFTGLNSSRVALERLATHLRSLGEPGVTLDDYLAHAYGPDSNGDGDDDGD
jgi:hypothetical protein